MANPAHDNLPVLEVLPALVSKLSKSGAAVLVAPPGAGKTTLLRIIAGLETETSGVIKIGDRAVNGKGRRRPIRRATIDAGLRRARA